MKYTSLNPKTFGIGFASERLEDVRLCIAKPECLETQIKAFNNVLMTNRRKNFLTFLIGCVLATYGWIAISIHEIYPFAPYTMYAWKKRPFMVWNFDLKFVDRRGNEERRDMLLHPLDHEMEITPIWEAIGAKSIDWRETSSQIVEEVYKNYLRNHSKTLEPEYAAAKLYRFRWGDLKSMRKGEPQDRTLIAAFGITDLGPDWQRKMRW